MFPKEEIQDIIDNLQHGLTVRGNLVAEAILYHGKNIENRTRKIKHKYLALHLGTGRISKDVERHLLSNIKERTDYKLKKGHIVAILKMSHAKHINELNEEEQTNKWVWRGAKYNVMNFIEKVYILKTPIKSRGFQCQTWKLECVDNALKQKNKFDISIKNKIFSELRTLQQGYIEEYEMIGKDCKNIIEEYKHDIEMYEIDINNLQDCLNTNSQRGNKNYATNLTLGEIKEYFDDNNIHNNIQIQIEIHKKGVLNTRYYDINFEKFNKTNKYLSNIKVQSYTNSYRPGVLCINLGVLIEEQFFKVLQEMDDIIYPDADIFPDIYEDEMFQFEEEYDWQDNY